jgi:hypothetical protein
MIIAGIGFLIIFEKGVFMKHYYFRTRNSFLTFLFFFFVFSSLYSQDNDTIVSFRPGPEKGIDAYIENYPNDNYANRNWGDYDSFTAVAWTANGIPLVVRSLLKFDLTSISSSTKIKRATLTLYSVNSTGIGDGHSTLSGPNGFSLNRITSPWDEHKVTWNLQPTYTNQDSIIFPQTNNDFEDFYNIDVTKLVQLMISSPSSNYGFLIKLNDETEYRRVLFGSSDNKDVFKRPILVIVY